VTHAPVAVDVAVLDWGSKSKFWRRVRVIFAEGDVNDPHTAIIRSIVRPSDHNLPKIQIGLAGINIARRVRIFVQNFQLAHDSLHSRDCFFRSNLKKMLKFKVCLSHLSIRCPKASRFRTLDKNYNISMNKIVERRSRQFSKEFLSEKMILTKKGPHRYFKTFEIT